MGVLTHLKTELFNGKVKTNLYIDTNMNPQTPVCNMITTLKEQIFKQVSTKTTNQLQPS